MTAVENTIPDVSSLVKKQIIVQKFLKLKKKLTVHNYGKYITSPELTKLTAKNFATRLNQAKSITKADFDDKLKSLNQKLIKAKQNIY